MNPGKELRRRVETCEIHHPRFEELLTQLRRRVDEAIDGHLPSIEFVVGPSRVGKTMLANVLAREYPMVKVGGRRKVPVLKVKIGALVSPSRLPISGLKALGIAAPPRENADSLTELLCEQLKLAETRVVLFEEASHLVEEGAKVTPREVTDWVKTVVDEREVLGILFGVPRLMTLLQSNAQLFHRSMAAVEFRPYDSKIPEELKAFASCVRTYAQLFEDAGLPIAVPMNALVPNCYLQTAGAVGLLSRFMQELATTFMYQPARPVTFDDCRETCMRLNPAGHPDYPAFEKPEVAPIALSAAHGYFIDAANMAFPSSRRSSERGR